MRRSLDMVEPVPIGPNRGVVSVRANVSTGFGGRVIVPSKPQSLTRDMPNMPLSGRNNYESSG